MDRYTFSSEWFKRGESLLNKFEETDNTGYLFESYIYLWISLTISVKQYWACTGKKFNSQGGKISTDKQEIKEWSKLFHERIFQLMNENRYLMEELSEQYGSETNNPIMDSKGDNTRLNQQVFSDYWLNNNNNHVHKREMVMTMIDILNRVRNNLFHGEKSFDNKRDIELLRTTCPILCQVAKLSIGIL